MSTRQPLRHIRHWISRKPLRTERLGYERTTNRKWPMGNKSTWQMASRKVAWPAQYLENSWRCTL